jgi:Calcineurin-like phosphoesterase
MRPLPEPWVDVRQLFSQLDQHGELKIPLSRSWVDALQSRGEPFIACLSIALGSGCVLFATQLLESPIARVLAGIVALLGFMVWLAANLSVADSFWDLVVGPFMRSRRQIQALYGGRANGLIRLALLVAGSILVSALCLVVAFYPIAVVVLALIGGWIGLFSRRVQIASLIFLVPGPCLVWGVRRLGSPLKRDWTASLRTLSKEPAARALTVAHISDLHLLSEGQITSAEGESIKPLTALKMVAASLRALDSTPQLIAVTGDITDTAGARAWKDCIEWIKDLRGTVPQAVVAFIPGNHDLNIVTSGELKLTNSQLRNYLRWIRYFPFEVDERRLQDINLLRCLLAMGLHYEDTALCLDENDAVVGLQSLLQTHADRINHFLNERLVIKTATFDPDHPDAKRNEFGSVPHEPIADFTAVWSPEERDVTDQKTREALLSPRAVWKQAWPMIVRSSKIECNLILLNSTRLSWSIADNAFGEVGNVQIKRVITLHKSVAEQTWPNVVLLHHSLPPPANHRSGKPSPFLCLEDSATLVEGLESLNPVYLSGHTHTHAVHGRWCAAGSLGYATDPLTSVAVRQIQVDRDGRPTAIRTSELSESPTP